MKDDKAKTAINIDGVATKDNQPPERGGVGVLAPAETSTVRPWTADFLLPSIRFREPAAPKTKPH
jgi:hypothetical protein